MVILTPPHRQREIVETDAFWVFYRTWRFNVEYDWFETDDAQECSGVGSNWRKETRWVPVPVWQWVGYFARHYPQNDALTMMVCTARHADIQTACVVASTLYHLGTPDCLKQLKKLEENPEVARFMWRLRCPPVVRQPPEKPVYPPPDYGEELNRWFGQPTSTR